MNLLTLADFQIPSGRRPVARVREPVPLPGQPLAAGDPQPHAQQLRPQRDLPAVADARADRRLRRRCGDEDGAERPLRSGEDGGGLIDDDEDRKEGDFLVQRPTLMHGIVLMEC